MSNQRVSQLAPITATELTSDDLLLVSDVTAFQSKKLTLSELFNYLFPSDNFSGSLFGTASYATNALTASYITIHSASYVPTSSWAYDAVTSSFSKLANTASNATTSSYALTASFTIATSVDFAYSSSLSNYTLTASYLLLDPNNATNGSASYALTASYFAGEESATSSYAINAFESFYADTASFSISTTNADTASFVATSSYLQFNGYPNGTASYAITAGNIANNWQDYGSFSAITQSITSSQLDLVTILPTFGGLQMTDVEIHGTLDVPFTSSHAALLGRVELFALERKSGISQSLDYSPVYLNLGGTATISGTLHYPVSLHGNTPLYGLYEFYVTTSNGITLDKNRIVRFKLSSTSDQLSVNSAEPMIFNTYPVNSILMWSSSLHPTIAYQGSASQVIFSGSSDVTSLLVPPGSVSNMNYTWTLTGCKKIILDSNTGLTQLGGIPRSCVTMSAAYCGLTELPDMSSGSVGYANFPGNNIVANLSLPPSMNYLNVAGNYYVNLPATWPAGIQTLVADGTGIVYIPPIIPDSLISMSFNSCPNLNGWLSPTLPANLKYLDTSVSPLSNLPMTMPSQLQWVNVSNCQLSPTIIGSIAQGLVNNGLTGGVFAFLNNPGSGSAFNISSNIATLISRGWNVIS